MLILEKGTDRFRMGCTTTASSGGITTTGGDLLLVAIFIKDDITVDITLIFLELRLLVF